MERSAIHIKKYDWRLDIFFAVTCYHVDEIMDSLADVECPDDIRDRVYSNLVKCDMDTGFTYSNKRLKCTVMVIGLHSSQAQFLNSFEHEMRHMVDDIAETFGLNMGGEEVAYLTGDMNSTLWKDIHKFICCDCKCKDH